MNGQATGAEGANGATSQDAANEALDNMFFKQGGDDTEGEMESGDDDPPSGGPPASEPMMLALAQPM